MKTKLIIMFMLVNVISGCSTIGDLEFLNDTRLQSVREVSHTFSKTMNVLNGSSPTNRSPSSVNRLYGHATNANFKVRSIRDVPYVTQNIQNIGYYLK